MKNQSNLPLYQLFVHPKDLRELKKDIWDDDPVPAVMKVNQKGWILISRIGGHISETSKRSHTIFPFISLSYSAAHERFT